MSHFRTFVRNFTISRNLLSNNSGQKLYDSHIPLTNLQKLLLAAGSSLTAIIDPYRHDLVADFGETTGHGALRWMHNKMMSSEEGRLVLEDRPRLHSKIIDYDKLANLPENTFGHHYSQFYVKNKVSPDTRKEVQFVDDANLAYVMQRYRELHDIMHTILDQPTTIRGEVIVKAFEGVQTRLPLCILGGLVGPLRLSFDEKLNYFRHDLGWAIRTARDCDFLMSIYFEKRFDQDIEDLRRELKIKLMSHS